MAASLFGILVGPENRGNGVVVLSQMNRDYERDNDKKKRKLRLSDLWESGAIEQDARCCPEKKHPVCDDVRHSPKG